MPGLWCASEKDIADLVDMAREFAQMSPYRDKKFSPASTERYLRALIDDHNTVIFRTDDGAVGAVLEHTPFCISVTARELFWFARKSGEGIRLLKEMEKWAKKRGADTVLMNSLSTTRSDIEKVDRVLNALGYECIEHTHIKAI